MDVTTTGWLAFWASFGYLVVGLATGAVVANGMYEDDQDLNDAYLGGGLATVLWPLAWVIGIAALLWFGVIARVLTPVAHQKKMKAKREKNKAEGKPAVASYAD